MPPLSATICLLAAFLPALAEFYNAPSSASFYVPTLPGLQLNDHNPLHIYAGHLASTSAPTTTIASHLYFFLIKAKKLADRERILFWFNGGPGCSSLAGLLVGNGPIRIDGKDNLKISENGWNEYATVVYVDQPVGTGFSYAPQESYIHDLHQAGDHLVEFLRNFYTVFPEYRDVETYLAGESYAGQFIPYIATSILASNLPTQLRGLAIGNGWIDGASQYPSYLEYGLKHGIFQEGTRVHEKVKYATERCMERLKRHAGHPPPDWAFCGDITSTMTRALETDSDGPLCLNLYDIRGLDASPHSNCTAVWPPELTGVGAYLNRPEVVQALHATHKSEPWVECTAKVGAEFSNDTFPSSITLLPTLLEQVNLLLFSGDRDFLCNYIGTESLISNLWWNGENGLGDAETLPWMVDGIDAGTWVTARNLTYVKIFNASHMVPYDVPRISHSMMLEFMGVSPMSDGTTVSSKLEHGNTHTLDSMKSTGSWKTTHEITNTVIVILTLVGLLILSFFLYIRRRTHQIFVSNQVRGAKYQEIPRNPPDSA